MNKSSWKRQLMMLVLLGVMVFGVVATAAAKIPVLRFVGPFDGDTVSGQVMVSVFSPDPYPGSERFTPRKELRLIASEQPEVIMTLLGDHLYATKWDTTTVADGWQELKAIEVTYTQPPTVQTVTIQVYVNNSGIDPVGTETGGLEIAAVSPANHTDPPPGPGWTVRPPWIGGPGCPEC